MGVGTSTERGAYCTSCIGGRDKRVRVLVTGASGLLGRQIMRQLNSEKWEVRGLYSSRAGESLVHCDLTQNAEIERQFVEFAPDVVIHSAAERRPDVVFKKPDLARTLNIEVTSNLAEACHKHKALIIFLSTDYIFDGEQPPYATDADPHPLSTYGEQKVAGEQICLEKCEASIVLRVPLLYGPMEYAKESGVTALYEELRKGMTKADHLQKRYPTYTCDVAKILKRMLEVHFGGRQRLSGAYHWQADESLTKYDMVIAIADIVAMDATAIEASTAAPKFPVPPDSRLDCSRLEKDLSIIAAEYRTPFKDALRTCLVDFLDGTPIKNGDSPTHHHHDKEHRASMGVAEARLVFDAFGVDGGKSMTLMKVDKGEGQVCSAEMREYLEHHMKE